MSEINQKAEMKVIGNLMLDETLDVYHLRPEYFAFDETKMIFESIVKNRRDGIPTEMVYIEHDKLTDFISQCMDYGIVTANFKHNCDYLIKLYSARCIYDLGNKLQTVKVEKVSKYLEKAKKKLDEIGLIAENLDLRTVKPEGINFLNSKKGVYVPTGFETVDYMLNDLEPQRVTLVTGKSFEGKTTVVRGCIVNAIDKGCETLWVMGENEIKDELRRFYQCVIGKRKDYYDSVLENKRIVKIPKPDVLKFLNKWSDGKLTIIHKAEARLKTHEELFEVIERELSTKGHKLIVIDNLMSVLSATSFEKNEAQADFMQRCCDLAKIYNTHFIIVLHPRKSNGRSFETKHFSNDDIAGTSDIPNKADNIIWVSKSSDDEKENGIDGWINVTKNKRWGTTGKVSLMFDRDTESLCEYKDGKAMINTYNIKIEKPLQINEQFLINDAPF